MVGWYWVINLYFLVLEVGRIVDAGPPLCRYLVAPNLEWLKFFEDIYADHPSNFFSSCLR